MSRNKRKMWNWVKFSKYQKSSCKTASTPTSSSSIKSPLILKLQILTSQTKQATSWLLKLQAYQNQWWGSFSKINWTTNPLFKELLLARYRKKYFSTEILRPPCKWAWSLSKLKIKLIIGLVVTSGPAITFRFWITPSLFLNQKTSRTLAKANYMINCTSRHTSWKSVFLDSKKNKSNREQLIKVMALWLTMLKESKGQSKLRISKRVGDTQRNQKIPWVKSPCKVSKISWERTVSGSNQQLLQK